MRLNIIVLTCFDHQHHRYALHMAKYKLCTKGSTLRYQMGNNSKTSKMMEMLIQSLPTQVLRTIWIIYQITASDEAKPEHLQ